MAKKRSAGAESVAAGGRSVPSAAVGTAPVSSTIESKEAVVSKDRFSQMNGVLDECTKAVAGEASKYREAQARIGADKTNATASPLTHPQAMAMASRAVEGRRSEIIAAAVASVAAEIELG